MKLQFFYRNFSILKIRSWGYSLLSPLVCRSQKRTCSRISPVFWVALQCVVVPSPPREMDGVVDVVVLLHAGCIYHPQGRRFNGALQRPPHLEDYPLRNPEVLQTFTATAFFRSHTVFATGNAMLHKPPCHISTKTTLC
jgi:hypothetical protein